MPTYLSRRRPGACLLPLTFAAFGLMALSFHAAGQVPKAPNDDSKKAEPITLFLMDGASQHLRTEDRWEKALQTIANIDDINPKGKGGLAPGFHLNALDLTMSSLLKEAEGAPQPEFEAFASKCRGRLQTATTGLNQIFSTMAKVSSAPLALASAYGSRGDDGKACQIFEGELKRLAREKGDQLAEAQGKYGIHLISMGRHEAGEKLFRDSLTLRQTAGLAGVTKSWLLLAGLEAVRERKAESLAAVKEAEATVMKGSDGTANNPLFTLGFVSAAQFGTRTRYLSALDGLTDLSWQLQAQGKYEAADRVMDLARAVAPQWLSSDDIYLVKQKTLASLLAFAVGMKDKSVTLGTEANNVAARALAGRSWELDYEGSAEMLSAYQSQEVANVAASLDSPALLEQELLTEKNFAFRQEIEKRRRLQTLSADASVQALETNLASQRVLQRNLVLVNHVGSEMVAGMSTGVEMKAKIEQVQKRLQETGNNNPAAVVRELKEAFEHSDNLKTIQDKIRVSQKTLSATLGSADVEENVDVLARITQALPKDAAFVDYVVVDRWTEKIFGMTEWCAVVNQPGRPPVISRCASSKIVRDQIAQYRHLAGSGKTGPQQDAAIEAASRALYASLVAPVEKILTSEARRVFVCPDGPLGFVGLASLLDETGHFWCEHRDIRFVSDARALLRHPEAKLPSNVAAFLGDPDFANPAPQKGPIRKMDVATAAGFSPELKKHFGAPAEPSGKGGQFVTLPSLAGTREEVSRLRQSFTDAGWQTQVLAGADASEEALKAIHWPTILHIATHGFYLSQLPAKGSKIALAFSGQGAASARPGEQDLLSAKGMFKRDQVSPMFLSMIALRGAQTTLRLWCDGQFPDTANDGILMADEVLDMDLSRTTLVTLSACETGLGESVRGEGSVGIQRALLMAGARNVLSTLWPIADAETVEFMDAFYRRVIAGETPASALSAVQKKFLIERREKGLAAAINLTAPFVLTSTEN